MTAFRRVVAYAPQGVTDAGLTLRVEHGLNALADADLVSSCASCGCS